ncbi:pyridoxal 5'-phosphate synthase glutaminase subunit PdxT [Methanobrevibacter curvatus]|uniref:Pyridoxal 5'-phosphate synthase subunit PdxT n=1 Tax=Methanobrevibacter curvatus TaxID=49547 RepID=A0A166BZD2_9EURY|nr:pyridoxal 5'-phosphate synthase glutaminase subunit PdxT [Methanobrevibacter curvatus]KZX10027.1 glutamine amidotransferase subunit PdxT [Methanobrevibacter curvatus]
MLKIGILNLQGAVSEHYNITVKTIKKLNFDCEAVVVRYKEDLENCSGLIISGGESTVIGKLIVERGIDKVIHDKNIPIFGTCAGLVLMANDVDYNQAILKIIDMKVLRNAFGSQKNSFEEEIEILGSNFQGVFIRAPSILKVGKDVEVLSKIDDVIVGAKYGKNIALSFHPELTDDTRLHEYFIKNLFEE